MRTTLTLEDDVSHLVKETMNRERRSLKEVVNIAIRRGLSPGGTKRKRNIYKVVTHKTKLRAGVDAAKLNLLDDELEVDAFLDRKRAP
jgi:hypothetical protein